MDGAGDGNCKCSFEQFIKNKLANTSKIMRQGRKSGKQHNEDNNQKEQNPRDNTT